MLKVGSKHCRLATLASRLEQRLKMAFDSRADGRVVNKQLDVRWGKNNSNTHKKRG